MMVDSLAIDGGVKQREATEKFEQVRFIDRWEIFSLSPLDAKLLREELKKTKLLFAKGKYHEKLKKIKQLQNQYCMVQVEN